jgi:hypothetical protein
MSIERAKALVGALSDGIGSDAELRELLTILPPMLDDAASWRKGTNVLRELQERLIPCGHTIEDLIGGEGSVTKCGACLAARQKAKDEAKLEGVAIEANDAEIFKWIERD